MSPEPSRTSKVSVTVEGRALALSNLDKVLYPESGFTKGEVIDYYTRIAPVLLPHLSGRPVTFKRYPDGVQAQPFFQKNRPAGTPDWVRTVRLPAPGSTKDREVIDYAMVEELAALVWAANLAAIELHLPMWQVDQGGAPQPPDLLVVDLDPGPPADVLTCAQVALLVRDALDADGLAAHPKTSGSKGLQLYAALDAASSADEISAYARALAIRLEKAHPALVVSSMTKSLRPGKVLIDWSQNNAAKTTVAVYSLRARPTPTVSTPVRWREVEAAIDNRDPSSLVFTAGDVLARVREHGDLFAQLRPAERSGSKDGVPDA